MGWLECKITRITLYMTEGGEKRDQILAIYNTSFYLCNRLNRTGFQGD
ncbi:hypothetical protein EAS1808013_p11010 (plasmid) [Enterobacter asburiae]|nr:hypothetical protein EAS1808013_p11010 [Enterobacter asburiae]